MMNKKQNLLALTAFAVITLMMSACSTVNSEVISSGGEQISDPFEGANRTVFAFNNKVDDVLIHPIAKGYNYVPRPARNGFTNFLRNLRSPVTFTNQLLQGDLQGAGDVVVRASVNTLLGLGGIVDIAGQEGIAYEPEDFGQTLATWGVDHGPYLVVPIVGPASSRDYVGFVVDSFADPLRYYLFNIDKDGLYYGKVGSDYLTLRASLVDVLEDLENSSIDYYAATRSAYYQNRAALVNDNGNGGVSASIPDYDDF